jgi:hypothetical protein
MVTEGDFVSEQLSIVGALINELLSPSPIKYKMCNYVFTEFNMEIRKISYTRVTSGKGNVHIMKTRSSSVSSAPIKPIHL